jgi:hypothetical protein
LNDSNVGNAESLKRVGRLDDVLGNTEAVLERIAEALTNPHPGPLPGRAREKRNADQK